MSRCMPAIAVGLATALINATVPAICRASTDGIALNGRYQASSNGDRAKTNEVYHDEAVVRSIWTITSSCSDPFHCTGTVTSDQGWSAPVSKTSISWTLSRDIADWERCTDGTTAPGHQEFRFWRVDNNGETDLTETSPTYAGEDKTLGASGACGVSKWLAIRMPFRLDKID
ncbi:hypothetical protein MINTM021_11730 [Mycobacterium paraintracellulare]|nr:hypothetical protein MINTM021_11730 [Mycobacterium paraintracellulare]